MSKVVKVVMVILVKIDFRKGHFYTIIYKYIYIIEYFSFFPFSILTILTMTIMTTCHSVDHVMLNFELDEVR